MSYSRRISSSLAGSVSSASYSATSARVSSSIVLALLLLLQPAPPPFSARWIGNHSIRIEWQQPAGVDLTCLYRGSTLIQCYRDLSTGATYTTLGQTSPLDYAAHPAAGDVYTLAFDGQRTTARLGWVLWLAEIRR